MNAGRILREYRPLVVFMVLFSLSFFSLVTGFEGTFIYHGISRIVNVTSYPFLKMRHVSVSVPGNAYHFVTNYNTVYSENKELIREVVEFKKREALYRQLFMENIRLRKILGFISDHPLFTLKPATVLESYRGMLRIDAGARAGIKPSMGVITKDGVAGIVTEVADFTSTVATLHHTDCRVGAMVLRKRLRAYDGVVRSAGSDFSHLCAMEYIDMKDEVRVGDIIVTNPESIFPAGITIGRIVAVRSGEGLWKSAEIFPAVDPYRLDEVMVIMRAADTPEYIAGPPVALRHESPLDFSSVANDSAAPESPDMRSLQERYAP
ncbi:MAG: rod shape-determining protein MreC [Candidatus Hydrogenedentes bacterium]|nr:rod shape-determining protein MreC [Candidatus Hydrogenedentota bacterium]